MFRIVFSRSGSRALPAITGILLVFAVARPWAYAQGTAGEQDEYHQAETLVRDHQWDEGLAVVKSLLNANPGNLRALNLAALALTGKGNIEEADKYFERALAIDPGFVPARKNLAINEFNAEHPAEAERNLRLVLKAAPEDPVANLYLGKLQYKRQKFAEAATMLAKTGPFLRRDSQVAAALAICYLSLGEPQRAFDILDLLPGAELPASTQLTLGVRLAAVGAFERAVPFLESARNAAPGSYDVSFDLALSYFNLKQDSRAIETLRAAVARGEETAELDNLLAEAYEANQDTPQAIASFRRAIALAPEDEDNYLDFASLCIDHQDFAAALQVLNVGLQTHPKSDRLLFERAILHAMQDNFQLAEADFQQVARLTPEKGSTYKGLGVLYLEAGNAAQAVLLLKKRLQQQPHDADLLYLLGEALLRAGAHPGDTSYTEAEAAFQKSVRLNPASCLARVSLGKMYLEQDKVAEALAQLEQARAIDPKEKSTYWQLALAYRKSGQPEKQKEVLNALKNLNDEERNGVKDKTRTVKDATRQGPSGAAN